jgi:hypothetical protein
MRSEDRLTKGGRVEKAAISGSQEWNGSLISGKPVRVEYIPYPTESPNHCQKRVTIAIAVFLAIILVLSALVLFVIWARIHGLF